MATKGLHEFCCKKMHLEVQQAISLRKHAAPHKRKTTASTSYRGFNDFKASWQKYLIITNSNLRLEKSVFNSFNFRKKVAIFFNRCSFLSHFWYLLLTAMLSLILTFFLNYVPIVHKVNV